MGIILKRFKCLFLQHINMLTLYRFIVKSILTTLFLCISLCATAQNEKLLVGKWQYKDIFNKEGLSDVDLMKANMMLSDLTYHFKDDKQYQSVLFGIEESGTWSLNENETEITLNSDEGKTQQISIIKLDENQLFINKGTANIILEKATALEKTTEIEAESRTEMLTYEFVPATKKQIAKEWFLEKIFSSDKGLNEMMMLVAKGTVLRLKKDGQSEMGKPDKIITSTWKFGETNTSIKIAKNTWHIMSISDTQLAITLGNTKEVWKFSSKK